MWLLKFTVGYQTERNKLPAEINHKQTKGKKSINNKTRDSSKKVAALNSKRKGRKASQRKPKAGKTSTTTSDDSSKLTVLR